MGGVEPARIPVRCRKLWTKVSTAINCTPMLSQAGRMSAVGHALRTNAPVISDVATERRFSTPRLLIEHGVRSTVNVVIRGEKRPFRVLEVNSRQRSFGQDDIDFLQNYANLLASAVDRLERQQELEEGMNRQQLLLNELQHRVNNMLTTIRAVARRTRAHSANLDQFAKALDDRLSALARIHNLFSQPGKMAATMREILTQELSAQGAVEGNNFVQTGPDIALPTRKTSSCQWHFTNSRPMRSSTERFPQRTAASASHGSLIATVMASTCSCAGARAVSQLSNLRRGAVLALNFLKNQSSICLAAVLTEHFILTELNVRCSFELKLTPARRVSDMPQRYRSWRANNNKTMPAGGRDALHAAGSGFVARSKRRYRSPRLAG